MTWNQFWGAVGAALAFIFSLRGLLMIIAAIAIIFLGLSFIGGVRDGWAPNLYDYMTGAKKIELPCLWNCKGNGGGNGNGGGSTSSCDDVDSSWLVQWVGPQEGRLDSDWTNLGSNQWKWGCSSCQVGTFVSASFDKRTTYLLYGKDNGSGGWTETRTDPGETIAVNELTFKCE